MQHFDIKIYGRVQGIFFRYSAKKTAEKLGITGFARNESDGTVFIEAEGEKEDLEQFIAWCHKGPTLAKVDKVETLEGDIKHFINFESY